MLFVCVKQCLKDKKPSGDYGKYIDAIDTNFMRSLNVTSLNLSLFVTLFYNLVNGENP